MADPSMEGVFRQPFNEQVAFFRQKLGNLVPTDSWTEVQKSAHDTGFMVAGAANADLLADLAAAVDKAISQGTTLDEFRRDFKSIAARNGWAYRGELNWRTQVIYHTNLATSYAAGRLAQLREAGYSHWMYKHSGSAHPRKQHLAWNGLTLPADDAWWRTHYPPNGWGCNCRVLGVDNPQDVERYKGYMGSAPPITIDPRTGEPTGIDKGWGYMPGDTVSDTVRTMAAKTVQWQYTVGKQYMTGLPESVQDKFARGLRSLPSTGAAAQRFAESILSKRGNTQQYVTLGMVESKHVAQIKQMVFEEKPIKKKKSKSRELLVFKDQDVSGFDYTISQSSVGHIKNGHGIPSNGRGEKVESQKPIEPDDYVLLPEILNNPDQIIAKGVSDKSQLPVIEFVKSVDNRTYRYEVEISTGRKMLVAKTLMISERKVKN